MTISPVMIGFATSPVTRTSLSICMSPNSLSSTLNCERRYLQVHLPDAAPLDAELADGHEPIAIVVAQLEAIDEQPIALEQQPRDRVGVGHACRDDAEPAVGRFDEAVQSRRLERSPDAHVGAELPRQLRQLRRRRLEQRDVDGRALHREIELFGSRRAARTVRERESCRRPSTPPAASARGAHRHRPRAPSNWPCR